MLYRVCKTRVSDDRGHRFVSYGVKVNEMKIEDVSLQKHQFCAFVAGLNRGRLDPVHLQDVIEDFLLKNCNRIG